MQSDRGLGIEDGGALILAAGLGRRFGSDKRTYRIKDGTPMLLATASRYAAVFPRTSVVLRPGDEPIAEQLRQRYADVQIIFADDAHLGMGHSLAAGIRQVAGHWAFACIGLADMPFIESRTLQELWRSFQNGPPGCIVQPVFQGRPGHPVIFPRACFDVLAKLTGDQGARALLQDNPQMLVRVEVTDSGVIEDVDRPPNS